MTRTARLFSAVLLVHLVGCGGDDDGAPPLDAGAYDAQVDSGHDAAVASDAGIDAAVLADAGVDAGSDAGVPDAGADLVGVISGLCGELDDSELLSPMPFVFVNHIDFTMGFDEVRDAMRISEGAQEILSDGTAGGSSGMSEAFSFEVLHRCEGAVLIKSETEIVYDPEDSKKTDILVEIDGHNIGVSVTRAYAYPPTADYPVSAARTLLERKLGDILESSANVVMDDEWVKQILHVIAYSERHAESMLAAWELVAPETRADTILWVTITDGDDEFIY